jgi:hypothetical protein
MAFHKNIAILLSVLTVSITLCPNNVSSFTIQTAYPTRRQTSDRHTSTSNQHATIIGWDDESDSYISSFDEDTAIGTSILSEDDDDDDSTSTQKMYTSIADSLSHNTDKTASLARLAVAFSPPSQAVKLEDITQIQIIEVASDHIELSAVVCDESQCVTLFVPVTFHHDCGSLGEDESAEECVLDNLFELDEEAQQVIQRREIERKNSMDEVEPEIIAALHEKHDLQYPSWWIHPKDSDMVDECENIKRILNQDNFHSQVQALAREGLVITEDGDLFEIQKAVVSSLGPAGFYFRVIATKKFEDNHYTILDVPFSLNPFGQNPDIEEPSDLRAAVLGAVASVE